MNEIKPEHREAARSIMETMPLGLETVVAQLVADTEARVRAEERERQNTCWHCGVVLVERARPRCEQCPDECEIADCDEMGCEAAAKQQEQEP